MAGGRRLDYEKRTKAVRGPVSVASEIPPSEAAEDCKFLETLEQKTAADNAKRKNANKSSWARSNEEVSAIKEYQERFDLAIESLEKMWRSHPDLKDLELRYEVVEKKIIVFIEKYGIKLSIDPVSLERSVIVRKEDGFFKLILGLGSFHPSYAPQTRALICEGVGNWLRRANGL